MSELLTLASIVKTRGLRGEVVAEFYTDFPERFESLDQVCLEKSGYREWRNLESFWFQKGRIIFKFEGVDDPEAARELVGCDVRIPEEDKFLLPKDHFYDADLVGCRVVEKETILGTVKDVFRTGGDVSNLVVHDKRGLEFMIPLASEFCLSVDLEKRTIEVDLPPGMMDLASPADRK